MSLLNEITLNEIRKIFPNNQLKRDYLAKLAALSQNAGANLKKPLKSKDLDDAIIQSWNYPLSRQILREIFKATPKYKKNKSSKEKIIALMQEWEEMKLGELIWPFAPKMFDSHVHSINRDNITETEKDTKIALDAIKFRRIKDINALRNDYIEYLIFTNNQGIVPTFGNARGVDFYINGEPFDQKVGRSIGKAFIEKFGEKSRETAIEKPELVAVSLYENQDEERFGSEPRLLIVYLDTDLSVDDVEKSLTTVDFSAPHQIEFDYQFSNGTTQRFKTYCFIVLLHK